MDGAVGVDTYISSVSNLLSGGQTALGRALSGTCSPQAAGWHLEVDEGLQDRGKGADCVCHRN